jgi:hypothetical protein
MDRVENLLDVSRILPVSPLNSKIWPPSPRISLISKDRGRGLSPALEPLLAAPEGRFAALSRLFGCARVVHA